ncbi:MAG TPA: hypothetical protein VKR60_08885 [Candidatus Sulfotelmatobacter sp.]|nr:hypothetical protein [Candidatus Sulfotelmatobacter sp.]
MNPHACCKTVSAGSSRDSSHALDLATSGTRTALGGPRRPTLSRRILDATRDFVAWIVPGSILALLPKCPACLVAYFALGTGLGISISAATYLRMALVILCVASLTYLAATRGRRLIRHLAALH